MTKLDPQPVPGVSARRMRLTRSADISRVFANGTRATDRRVTLLAVPNGLGHVRLAVAVSKRHGNAVRRNRHKRRLREAFRSVRDQLPSGWDYVLLPRAGAEPPFADLCRSIIGLAGRVTRKHAQRSDGEDRE